MPRCHAIGALLDAQPGLVDLVRQDLVRDLRQPHTGRAGLTAEQTLRAYVLKHVKNWDLRELRERTADGFTLRDFTRFFSAPVPTHKAFHRAFCRLRPETVRALNEAVVRAAVAQGLEDGHRLRSDTTVVETNIHFPTDSGLLWDGVRVLTRLVGKLQALLPELAVPFVNHTRRARRRMQEIERLTPTQRADAAGPQVPRLDHAHDDRCSPPPGRWPPRRAPRRASIRSPASGWTPWRRRSPRMASGLIG